jgi:hypothetical protein
MYSSAKCALDPAKVDVLSLKVIEREINLSKTRNDSKFKRKFKNSKY